MSQENIKGTSEKNCRSCEGSGLDSVDIRLLRILEKDARTPLRKMAREVGLSISGVRRRVQQMEKRGIIKGQSVIIDPKKYGYEILAIITIGADPRSLKEMVSTIRGKHEVCELHLVSGGDHLVAKIRSKSVDDLNKFLKENITSFESVKHISTMIAMETFKETLLNP